MVKPGFLPEWGTDGRIIELNFSGATSAGDTINGAINTIAITPVVFASSDAETLIALATEISLNENVESAVAATNKLTITGMGLELLVTTPFTAVGGSAPTITENETNAGTASVLPPTAGLKTTGYATNAKPSAQNFNWLFKLWANWIDFQNSNPLSVQPTADIAALESLNGADLTDGITYAIDGFGIYQYSSTSVLIADGEAVVEPNDSIGRFLMVAVHPDGIWVYLGYYLSRFTVIETLDFGSVSANSSLDLTVSAPGVAVDDGFKIDVTPPSNINAGLIPMGFVSAIDTITIRLLNVTGGAINPAAGNYIIEARKVI